MRSLAWAFILVLPVLLVCTSVRTAFTSQTLYEFSLDQFGVMERTGLARIDLVTGVRGLIAYWSSDEEFIEVIIPVGTELVPLFNQREVLHLRDVKTLVKRVFTLQAASVAYSIGYTVYSILGYLIWRGHYLSRYLWGIRWGGIATVSIFGVAGIASLVGFDDLFWNFHLLSFDNTLWILDPTKDRLLQMFPQDFFLFSTLVVVGACVVGATISGGVAWLLGRWLSYETEVRENRGRRPNGPGRPRGR